MAKEKNLITDFHENMPNIILFDKLIFTEIFPLENHGMEDKKVFQLCKEGVKVKEMCLI